MSTATATSSSHSSSPSSTPSQTACRAQGVEAIAVCFLHAYAHPEHELAARDRLLELLPDAHVSISSEITREWREYERTSTAVLNGYVQPAVAGYLDDLGASLAEQRPARGIPRHAVERRHGDR